MTAKQIKYVLEDVLNETIGVITPMLGCRYITFLKFDNKICDPRFNRFKFIMNSDDTCSVHCYKCKQFNGDVSDLVEGKHYDILNGKTYLYLLDDNNQPIIDIYDGKDLIIFGIREDGE